MSQSKRISIARHLHITSAEDDIDRLAPSAMRQEIIIVFAFAVCHFGLSLYEFLISILESDVEVKVGKIPLGHHLRAPGIALSEAHHTNRRHIESVVTGIAHQRHTLRGERNFVNKTDNAYPVVRIYIYITLCPNAIWNKQQAQHQGIIKQSFHLSARLLHHKFNG